MISEKKIIERVSRLCISTNVNLDKEIVNLLQEALLSEKSPRGRMVLKNLIENVQIAKEKKIPVCQDTGLAIFFVEAGIDLKITDDRLKILINEGVRKGYQEGFLRKSVVKDALLDRRNTQDNTPAIIHLKRVQGERLKIAFISKGAGSENMSRGVCLKPSAGIEGVKNFVQEVVKNAGGNACPPVIVGIGVGGSMDYAAYLSKKALLRPLGKQNPDKRIAKLEKEILECLNKSGIGPLGFGGSTTALKVMIETYPSHIASLPVAVNLNCWVHRVKEIVL